MDCVPEPQDPTGNALEGKVTLFALVTCAKVRYLASNTVPRGYLFKGNSHTNADLDANPNPDGTDIVSPIAKPFFTPGSGFELVKRGQGHSERRYYLPGRALDWALSSETDAGGDEDSVYCLQIAVGLNYDKISQWPPVSVIGVLPQSHAKEGSWNLILRKSQKSENAFERVGVSWTPLE
jgi:hypothetical protein